jgi:hypothetical protein
VTEQVQTTPKPSGSSTGTIRFECMHMIEYLRNVGHIEDSRLHGDFMSWDTVGNAMVLRMFIEGYLDSVQHATAQLAQSNWTGNDVSLRSETTKDRLPEPRGLDVKVFISDFHANRVEAAFSWVLSLEPTFMRSDAVKSLKIERVPSEDLWFGGSSMVVKERMAHECRFF